MGKGCILHRLPQWGTSYPIARKLKILKTKIQTFFGKGILMGKEPTLRTPPTSNSIFAYETGTYSMAVVST